MRPAVSMTGKTVLITGGTGGIGKATAIGLARMGARVGIVGRDAARAEAAAADIRSTSGNDAVDAYIADVSAQSEVRRLAAEVLEAYPRLDVLVNNVGGFWAHRHVTVDGLEHTFAVNHLAAFLLTDLLLERLKASAPARVVTVSLRRPIDGTDRLRQPAGRARLLGAAGLQPVEAGERHIHVRARASPGGHRRDVERATPGRHPDRLRCRGPDALVRVDERVVRPFMKSPAQGAETPIYLASPPEVEGVSGRYFANRKPKESNKVSYDVEASARLWQASAEFVGLRP